MSEIAKFRLDMIRIVDEIFDEIKHINFLLKVQSKIWQSEEIGYWINRFETYFKNIKMDSPTQTVLVEKMLRERNEPTKFTCGLTQLIKYRFDCLKAINAIYDIEDHDDLAFVVGGENIYMMSESLRFYVVVTYKTSLEDDDEEFTIKDCECYRRKQLLFHIQNPCFSTRGIPFSYIEDMRCETIERIKSDKKLALCGSCNEDNGVIMFADWNGEVCTSCHFKHLDDEMNELEERMEEMIPFEIVKTIMEYTE